MASRIETWEERIRRAEELSGAGDAASQMLDFYAVLLRAQERIFASFDSGRLSGAIERDLPLVRESAPGLLRAVISAGPALLAEEARRLLSPEGDELEAMLLAYWQSPSDDRFFAKALLQPYANRLAAAGMPPHGRPVESAANRCRFCGGKPQLSVLDAADAEAEGGGKSLLCATCLSTWPFPRVLCASCGESDERKLGYFHSPTYDHVRIEVCDSCRHYQKGIDRSRLGIAVPLVDEVAAGALDLWAREQGYAKIEMNLVGL